MIGIISAQTAIDAFGPGRGGELLRHIEGGIRVANGFAPALMEGLQ